MATLSIARKGGKSIEILAEAVAEVINISVDPVEVPENTDEGENVGSFLGTATFVAEDLSKQVIDGKITYKTSVDYEEGSTSVFLNGLYMTRGMDYDEVSPNEIIFIGSYGEQDANIFFEETTVISVRYVAS